jgi:hypothetical protein
MPSYRVVGVRVESPSEQAMRDWFAQQVLESPKNIEEGARLLIGLVTGLLGVLFTVLAVAQNPLPAYLHLPYIRYLGALAVVLVLVGLVAALDVVLPREWRFKPAKPASELETFRQIVHYKSRSLTIASMAFGAGIAVMAIALVAALLTMA